MSIVDYGIILLFIGYAVGTGIFSSSSASRNLEEYFLAGRSLKGWQAGLSMAATQFASDTPLLVCGIIATAGIFGLWQIWVYALSFLLLGFVLAPCWRRAQVLTDAELTDLRYGSGPTEYLRFFKAIYFGTIINCTVLAWVFFAAAKISEPFLLWNLWLPEDFYMSIFELVRSTGVPLALDASVSNEQMWINSTNNFISVFTIVFITLLYSTTGGLRAVVSTDILQLGIMTLATLVFSLVLLDAVGGISGLTRQLHDLYNNPNLSITATQLTAFTPHEAKNTAWSFFLVISLQWLIQINSDGTGYLAQRAMACRTDQDAKVAGLVHTLFTILIRTLMWIPIGLALLVIYPLDFSVPGEQLLALREGKYVIAISEYLPVGVKGCMVTAMLAALASTVDTHLNWGSSYWTNDIFKHFVCHKWLDKKPSPRLLVWVARLSNILILIIAATIGSQLQSINDTWQIFLLLGSGVGVVLVLRWFWWRISAWSEVSCIMVSILAAPFIFYSVEDPALRLLIMSSLCLVVAVVVSFLMGPEDHKVLKKFYDQVQPPGFWGPVSQSERQDRARLVSGFTALR